MDEAIAYDDLPMDWVGDWSGRRRRLSPDRTAVIDAGSGRRWTYAQLDDRAERVGTWLTTVAGLQAGDRICFLARNRIETIDLYLACGKTGIILAPLSFRLAAPELNDLLERIQPSALFHEPVFDELSQSLVLPGSCHTRLRWSDDGEEGRYETEVLAAAVGESCNRALSLSQPNLYIHTGGTTATPKICVVPHRQMVWNSVELIVAAPDGLGERIELLLFPLFHIGGWNTFTPIFHSGGCVVIMRQFDPGTALETIEKERVNHFGAVEAMLGFLADHPRFGATDLSCLQAITTAGAPCGRRAMEPFWERGIAVSQSYGQTEAGPSNFLHGRQGVGMDTLKTHHDSVGTSFFHCDYRIVDVETQEPVRGGQTGVLLMRSPHNFAGYLGEPERTSATLAADGWVWSGDLAREDGDGYVRIVGRADNLFVSGGENLSPEEIEVVLLQHPDIRQAVVVAVPDDRWGQVPAAALVGTDAPPAGETLRQWLASRLAKYKIPRHLVYIDEMPLTGAGKIDRTRIRQRILEG